MLPYGGTPVLFVKKKDGIMRVRIGKQQLNKVTILKKYHLPQIDDLLTNCKLHQFSPRPIQGMTFINFKSHTNYVKDGVQNFYGHYEFLVISFG